MPMLNRTENMLKLGFNKEILFSLGDLIIGILRC